MSKTKGGGSPVTAVTRTPSASREGLRRHGDQRRHDRRASARHALSPRPQCPACGRDDTLFAMADGKVKFGSRHGRSPRGRRTVEADARRQMSAFPARGRCSSHRRLFADPNFFRSVIFLLAHDDEDGTLGVVLKPAEPIPVEEVVRNGKPRGRTFGAFRRGPVQPSAAICIGRTEHAGSCGSGRFRAASRFPRTVDLHEDPADLPRCDWPRIRVFHRLRGLGPDSLPTRSGRDRGTCSRLRPGCSSGDPGKASGPGSPSSGRMARRCSRSYPADLASN